jgi:NAD(P)-dependent dehydrogenase (short-subunit alcohol dehydrogenase family)
MTSDPPVIVYGAYGHTGRFIVAELLRRGARPVLAGRDADRLQVMSAEKGGLDVRAASTDDPAALDRAVADGAAVINCAGPFAQTSVPLIEAALRAGMPYLDVAAELEVVESTFDSFDERARAAGVVVAPALAFYGGLGDLLATAAMGEWDRADRIDLAFALSSWKPTAGTRITGAVSKARRGGGRLVLVDGRLRLRSDQAAVGSWTYPEPFGVQAVAEEFTTADSVTMTRHLDVGEVFECMTSAPLADLAGPELARSEAVDGEGRSEQTFLIEAVVRRGADERRAVVRGRDIYAVTAPIVVEATERVLAAGDSLAGVVPAGAVSDARSFLTALAPDHLTVEIGR